MTYLLTLLIALLGGCASTYIDAGTPTGKCPNGECPWKVVA